MVGFRVTEEEKRVLDEMAKKELGVTYVLFIICLPVHWGEPQGCQFDGKAEFSKDQGIIADWSLEYFLSSNGLMRMLVFLSENIHFA